MKPTSKKPVKRKAASKRAKTRKTARPADLAIRLANGATFSAIAQELGVRRETVASWSRSQEIQDEVEQIKEDFKRAEQEARREALNQLNALQVVAVKGLGAVLKEGACETCGRPKADPRDIIKAADSILDRTGLPKTERIEAAGDLEVNLSADDAKADAAILTEAARILRARGLLDLADQVLRA